MSDLRRRDGKLKILHTIIGDFGKTLRSIAEIEEVDSILTGTISPSKSYEETLTFQYYTDNGLKLLAKTTTAVQEIFIVTATPELLLDELMKSGFLIEERTDVKHFKKKKHHNKANRVSISEDKDERLPEGKNKNAHPAKKALSHEEDPLTLRQMLNKDQLSALMNLKEQVKKPMQAIPQKGNPQGVKQAKTKPPAEDDFASLFAPEEDVESFEEMLNRSKLDPKFFK